MDGPYSRTSEVLEDISKLAFRLGEPDCLSGVGIDLLNMRVTLPPVISMPACLFGLLF